MPNGKLVGLGVVILLGLSVFFGTYFTVEQYERAVVTHAGSFGYVAGPGLHLKTPFLDSVTKLPTDARQLETEKLNTYTIDNQEVDARLIVIYQIPENDIPYIYAHVAQSTAGIEAKLQNMLIDRWKIEAGRLNVTEFSSKRAAVTSAVTAVVKEQAARLYHIQVLDVQLPNLDYMDSFRNAQAQAAVVKTQIEQSEGLRTKMAIDAETARIQAQGQANQQIELSKGQAESQLIASKKHAEAVVVEAQGQAKATVLNGGAIAESTRLQGLAAAEAASKMADALARSPSLVALTQAQKWNGTLPSSVYAGAPIPFLQTSK